MLGAQGAFELIDHGRRGGFSQTQGIGDGGRNQCGIAKRLQRDEANTSGKVLLQVSRYLERHSRFADTAGAREDQEAYLGAPEQRASGCHLRLSANQWCEWYRKIMRVDFGRSHISMPSKLNIYRRICM